MIKKFKLLASLALAFVAVSASAASTTFDVDNLRFVVLDETAKTVNVAHISATATEGDIIIPTSVVYNDETYTVTELKASAFYNNKKITSVVVPDGILLKNSSVFSGATALTSVTLPSNLTSLPYRCFYNCTALKSVDIPETCITFGSGCFYGSGITSIELPEGTTALPDEIFQNCKSLTSVVLPTSIETYGKSLFYGTTALTSFEFPANLTSIPYRMFYSGGLAGNLVIPEGITEVCEGAFYNCSNVTSITLPEGLKTVEKQGFYNCHPTSLEIPESVEYIGQNAFYSFTSSKSGALTSLVFKCKNPTIDNAAFSGWSKLASFDLPAELTDLNGFGSLTGLQSLVIPSTVSTIGGNRTKAEALSKFNVKTIDIPEGVTYIGHHTFWMSPKLEEITIPASVTELGCKVCYECTALKKVTFAGEIPDMNAEDPQFTNLGYYGYCFNGSAGNGGSIACTYPPIEEIHCENATTLPVCPESNFTPVAYTDATLYIKSIVLEDQQNNAPWNLFENVVVVDGPQADLELSALSITDGAKHSHLSMVSTTAQGTVVAAEGAAFQLLCGEELIATAAVNIHQGATSAIAYGNFGGIETEKGKSYTIVLPEGSLTNEDGKSYNAPVSVSFNGIDQAAEHVNVTLNLGEHATTVYKVAKNQPSVVNLGTSEHWNLTKLTVNNIDVTNDIDGDTYTIPADELYNDATVTAEYAYANDVNFNVSLTGANTVSVADYTIYSDANGLVIGGVALGSTVRVYNISGQLLNYTTVAGTAQVNDVRIYIIPGTYIVAINDTAIKINF